MTLIEEEQKKKEVKEQILVWRPSVPLKTLVVVEKRIEN